jgi:hypothetical protein
VAKTGLDKWFGENWVDIGAKKKDGKATSRMWPKKRIKKKRQVIPEVRSGSKSGQHDSGREIQRCQQKEV